MKNPPDDPLLIAFRTLLVTLLGLLIAAMVLVAIGFVAALTVQRTELTTAIADAALPDWVFAAVLTSLAGLTGILFLGVRFLTTLKQIVTTVEQGDPFVADNASRLARMGWLAVAVQVIAFPLGLLGAYLEQNTENVEADFGFSGGGLILVLTLFVLARVFKRGAEMRDELAATI